MVVHLTGGAERQARSVQRGRQGRAEPPAAFSPPDAVSMSASNAQRNITLCQRLAGSLLNTFVENHTRLYQLPDGIWTRGVVYPLLVRQARAHFCPG